MMKEEEEEVVVMIVGAGPAGLATAACLNTLSIPNVVLEKEDCSASLWKKKSYDRLKLHLAKQFCALPHMPFPDAAPTFVPKGGFIEYLDAYVAQFEIRPVYCTAVESASFDEGSKRWTVLGRHAVTGGRTEYSARFLVVATGENGESWIPDVAGLSTFTGTTMHSLFYKSGEVYAGKSVLVVGSGNSGMEIAYDLANDGAKTAISIRSPFHVMSKEMVQLGMDIMKYFPLCLVDSILLTLANIQYGDLSRYGIIRPRMGPLKLKAKTGRSSVIDVGTVKKIKMGEIKVFGGISYIKGNKVVFQDGKSNEFDDIIFATGYRSTANKWLKDGDRLLGKDGMPKGRFPNHWKGSDGLYCAGLGRRGLAGISMDAKNIAKDIKKIYDTTMVNSS